jgi:hypothetical protein
MGKLTISMAIFNSYVEFPEGIILTSALYHHFGDFISPLYRIIPPFLGFTQPDCRFKEYNVWKFTTDGDFTSNVGNFSLSCHITRGLTPQTH